MLNEKTMSEYCAYSTHRKHSQVQQPFVFKDATIKTSDLLEFSTAQLVIFIGIMDPSIPVLLLVNSIYSREP